MFTFQKIRNQNERQLLCIPSQYVILGCWWQWEWQLRQAVGYVKNLQWMSAMYILIIIFYFPIKNQFDLARGRLYNLTPNHQIEITGSVRFMHRFQKNKLNQYVPGLIGFLVDMLPDKKKIYLVTSRVSSPCAFVFNISPLTNFFFFL